VKRMIPKECKRLAEVDFPIAEVSRHAVREKSIRHGHPSTLHLWWARRPLAACRAMLLGLLLPDPSDPHCPEEFKEEARRLLPCVQDKVGPKDEDLSQALLRFIGHFSNWELSADPTYLEVGRGLVKAAHPEETPLVVDPFAGGGSIPLEALRLGCETFASDLNPVACLILKVLLEDIPRHGPELAKELRRVGAEIKEAAEKELAEFYPPDPDGSRPIAYLWARTVRCEAPNCGAEIPLMRSFWLCRKANRKRALRYKVVGSSSEIQRVEFEVFEPVRESEVPHGTVARAKATCLCCGTVLPPERVRAQLATQRGGADVIFEDRGRRTGGARLLAVVTLREEERGRHYRLASAADYQAIWKAAQELERRTRHPGPNGLSVVPDEPLPPIGTLGFRVQRYGMLQWGDLFTARQQLALITLTRSAIGLTGVNASVKPFTHLISLVVSRCVDYNSSLSRWATSGEFVGNTFGRQALPIVWDFCETVLMSEESGGYPGALSWVTRVVERQAGGPLPVGQASLADACDSTLPDDSAVIWFTDPPYYDAVPYADLSDYFFVWLKRTLPEHSLLRDPFNHNNLLTPKTREIVQDETKQSDGRPKDRDFFEAAMARAFGGGRQILNDDGIGCVVFAHKTTEGWEALLSGMIQGGWVITGSWPIATERAGRLRSQESAALATSVHLVCRPRSEDAPIGDWGEVLRELPRRVGEWMERLQSEGIRGADLVFACIGPALEIFSRYSKVETAEGRQVLLAEYLEKVWEVVGRTALEQILGTSEAKARNTAAGALEEDARLTALFLWTLQSTNGSNEPDATDEPEEEDSEGDGEETVSFDSAQDRPKTKKRGFTLVYDVARRFAQPLGIHLDAWKGRIIDIEKGVVRLLPVAERAAQLFGKEGAAAVADRIEREPTRQMQLALFSGPGPAPEVKARGRTKKRGNADVSDEVVKTPREATTLDRIHAAMLLQASGRANALRALLKTEQERGPDFLRLANALSALYARGSEEKRLLDAMLLAMPR